MEEGKKGKGKRKGKKEKRKGKREKRQKGKGKNAAFLLLCWREKKSERRLAGKKGRGKVREGRRKDLEFNSASTLGQLFVGQQLNSSQTQGWSCQLSTLTFNSEFES